MQEFAIRYHFQSYFSISDLGFLQAFCRILEKSYEEISNVKGVVDEGNIAAKFGQTADQICNSVKFH